MNLQTRLTNSTTHKDPQRSCTLERSENSSSSLQTCSLTNSRKPSLLTIIQEKEEENKELRQELQSMKEQNSMLSWQVSTLEQELDKMMQLYTSMMQEQQSKIASLIEENKKLRNSQEKSAEDRGGLSWAEFVRMQEASTVDSYSDQYSDTY